MITTSDTNIIQNELNKIIVTNFVNTTLHECIKENWVLQNKKLYICIKLKNESILYSKRYKLTLCYETWDKHEQKIEEFEHVIKNDLFQVTNNLDILLKIDNLYVFTALES